MHIVIDCRFVNHSGLGRYIREIVSRLVIDNKNKYTLIISNDEINSDFLEKIKRKNVEKIYCNSKMYSVKEQIELPLRIPKCDIFWAPHYNAPILPIRAHRKIVTIYDMGHIAISKDLSFIKRIYAKLLMYTSTHFYDDIFTISKFSKSEIMKYERISEKKISIQYCGINLENYMNIDIDINIVRKKYNLPLKYFLYVGNVKPHKNINRLIDAYAIFNKNIDSSIKLVIVGKKDGLLTGIKGLEEKLYKYKLDKDIIFTGFVEDKELPLLYKSAEAFLFPSLYEGFGIPPLEAMAVGCPVVVSRVASLPEIYGDSVLYVDPYNINDIFNGMSKIINKDIKNYF